MADQPEIPALRESQSHFGDVGHNPRIETPRYPHSRLDRDPGALIVPRFHQVARILKKLRGFSSAPIACSLLQWH